MKKDIYEALKKKLLGSEILIFFDLEATQFFHKAIAIGVLAYKKEKGTLLIEKEPVIKYYSLIKTDSPIGPVVKDMTGITETQLFEEGKSFSSVFKDISLLLRNYSKRTFLSYGSFDISVLEKTVNYNIQLERNFLANIKKNYFDLYKFIYRYMWDEKGSAYSVKDLIEAYQIKTEISYHNALADSIALKEIYNAMVTNKDLTYELIEKNKDKRNGSH